jgi:hypothetical protein
MEDQRIEPWNNWARVSAHIYSDQDQALGAPDLRFIFVWENPSTKHMLIDVSSYLMLLGSATAGSDGGTFPATRWTNLTISADLHILEWWEMVTNQPIPEPAPQSSQSNSNVFHLNAYGGDGFFSLGDVETGTIMGNYDVSYTLFDLPPQKVVVFEVAFSVGYKIYSSGGIDLDCLVTCPAVVLAIQS